MKLVCFLNSHGITLAFRKKSTNGNTGLNRGPLINEIIVGFDYKYYWNTPCSRPIANDGFNQGQFERSVCQVVKEGTLNGYRDRLMTLASVERSIMLG